MILLIDNYDSFVYNLVRYVQRLGQQTTVVRNDRIDIEGIRRISPDAIVLSPGPCTPLEAGCCLEVVRRLSCEIPMLGVCLGHQAIAQAWGGAICRAPEPVHGRASDVRHDQLGVFATIPSPFRAARYHSLVVDDHGLPSCLRVTARTDDGVIMAIQHCEYPTFGWQFHPESILTEHGLTLIAAFLNEAGLVADESRPVEDDISGLLPDGQSWFQQPASSWGTP